jgi:ribosomal protein L7Ae-like RNA K-turn-binding protein
LRPDKIVSYIGLAMKAGKVSSGEFSVEKSVKEGKAEVVIISTDASKNTKKKFNDMCKYYRVPAFEYLDKDTLGRIIGREMRACVSINDPGFAKAILSVNKNEFEE